MTQLTIEETGTLRAIVKTGNRLRIVGQPYINDDLRVCNEDYPRSRGFFAHLAPGPDSWAFTAREVETGELWAMLVMPESNDTVAMFWQDDDGSIAGGHHEVYAHAFELVSE